MAALIKAANAKIRSNPMLDYVCSTRTYSTIRSNPMRNAYEKSRGRDIDVVTDS